MGGKVEGEGRRQQCWQVVCCGCGSHTAGSQSSHLCFRKIIPPSIEKGYEGGMNKSLGISKELMHTVITPVNALASHLPSHATHHPALLLQKQNQVILEWRSLLRNTALCHLSKLPVCHTCPPFQPIWTNLQWKPEPCFPDVTTNLLQASTVTPNLQIHVTLSHMRNSMALTFPPWLKSESYQKAKIKYQSSKDLEQISDWCPPEAFSRLMGKSQSEG